MARTRAQNILRQQFGRIVLAAIDDAALRVIRVGFGRFVARVTTVTATPASANCKAATAPAMPQPMMRTSV